MLVDELRPLQHAMTDWRRTLHADPELLFDLHRTAGFVAGVLRESGCDVVVEGVGGTGVVGVIAGTTPGPMIGLRADMDALPVPEATGVPWASRNPGVMHACGHDGHTAMLLGAARHLASTRRFTGSVILIFQPAEEGGNGAKAMINDGLFKRWPIEDVYALHNMPGLAAGNFVTRPGPLLGAVDDFTIEVRGRGGHAARPHTCVDPVLAAAQIVSAIQSVASRNVDPVDGVVVSVCGIRSSTDAHNVIPDSVTLKGTCRSLSDEVRHGLEKNLKRLVGSTATAFGANATIRYVRGCAQTVNDANATERAIAAAFATGHPVHTDVKPLLGGEDFAFMLRERPGAMMFLGNGDTAGLHSPSYDFNDEILVVGAAWFVALAEHRPQFFSTTT
jgi:hippurate hydrolase